MTNTQDTKVITETLFLKFSNLQSGEDVVVTIDQSQQSKVQFALDQNNPVSTSGNLQSMEVDPARLQFTASAANIQVNLGLSWDQGTAAATFNLRTANANLEYSLGGSRQGDTSGTRPFSIVLVG